MQEKINCTQCNSYFKLSQKELEFIKKFEVPNPNECYNCRLKKQMAFWPSIGRWYSRKCDATGESIVTNYSPDSRFPVYKSEYFHSDKWSPDFLDLDMDNTVFNQLKTLQEKVPRPHQLGNNIENCQYCDDARDSKSCYLASSFLQCENIYYGYRVLGCKDSTDLVFCWYSSLCTSLIYSRNCYKILYSAFVDDSNNGLFLYDCKNVNNCFMSWNLRNAEYCIRNKQYSKEEYFKELEKYDFASRKQIYILQKEYEEHLKNDVYHPENFNESCEKSSGNFMTNSNNIENGFLIENTEDGVNNFRGIVKKCMDSLSVLDGENSYQIGVSAYLFNIKFASYCTRCKNSEYLDNCVDVENCFACVGLKNKKYCILNKQYTKEEYEELLPKIKMKMWKDNEYGKFFPYNMMYTGYNTTFARMHFEETKESIEKLGGYWEEDEVNNGIQENIGDFPDNIFDIPELDSGITAICEKTGKKFNYIKQVISLHKKINAPLFPIFHLDRIVKNYSYLTGFRQIKGKCSISGKDITHYYPESFGYKNIVSMEEYNKIVN